MSFLNKALPPDHPIYTSGCLVTGSGVAGPRRRTAKDKKLLDKEANERAADTIPADEQDRDRQPAEVPNATAGD